MLGIMVSVFILAFSSATAIAQDTKQEEAQVPFSLGLGKQTFEENCASCHGNSGYGTKKGPPLMHAYYKPSHHGDHGFL